MRQTITETMFIQGFIDCNRKENFSYDALRALFQLFEWYEEDCDAEIEYDPIGICCEWTESTLQEVAEYYSIQGDEEEIFTYLQDNTQSLMLDNGKVLYMQF